MSKIRTIPSKLGTVPKTTLGTVNSNSWRKPNQSSSARGYNYQWQKYRLRFLLEHPLCEYCEREGRTTAANVVDHRQPHQGNKDLFWDPHNHCALCSTCHDGTKAKEEIAAGYRDGSWKSRSNVGV